MKIENNTFSGDATGAIFLPPSWLYDMEGSGTCSTTVCRWCRYLSPLGRCPNCGGPNNEVVPVVRPVVGPVPRLRPPSRRRPGAGAR